MPTAIDVLANDDNPAGRPVRIVDFDPEFPTLTTALGAQVSCNAWICWYVPPKDAAGPFPLTDTFTYQATDGRGDLLLAIVTITVIDNRPPVTTADSATVRGPDSINVLENDSDPTATPSLRSSGTRPPRRKRRGVLLSRPGTASTSPTAREATRSPIVCPTIPVGSGANGPP